MYYIIQILLFCGAAYFLYLWWTDTDDEEDPTDKHGPWQGPIAPA